MKRLVIWGGEFGRTIYCQGQLARNNLRARSSSQVLFRLDGRRWCRRAAWCMAKPMNSATTWLATPYIPETCNATILHLDGHRFADRLTYPFQGLDQRLTGCRGRNVPVQGGDVMSEDESKRRDGGMGTASASALVAASMIGAGVYTTSGYLTRGSSDRRGGCLLAWAIGGVDRDLRRDLLRGVGRTVYRIRRRVPLFLARGVHPA